MNKQNKARVETIMMNAHTEGNGIKTALIPVDLCELSPIYQRDQGRHVAHIASNWDDNKAGHLEASERGDHFNIWDGGNRLRAAVMVGKTHVLCNIRTGLTDEDEAHLFVTQEENVTKLTQYDKFIAACASGEERGKVALLLRDICDEYGIKIKKACGKNSAGVLTAISVALAITNNEPDELRWVFRIIREANWHMEPGAYSRSVIMALNYVYTARCDISPDELRTEIVKIISQSSPKRFEYMARACYIDRKPSNAMASVIEHYINNINDYSEDEIEDVLHYYSYENLDDFVQEISPATIERKADGTLDRESPNYIVEWQLIAEMLFETEALYRHLVPGKIWNEYEMAAAYIRKTIGQEEENEED